MRMILYIIKVNILQRSRATLKVV